MELAELFTQFFFNTPLYAPFKIADDDLHQLLYYHNKYPFPGYNPIDHYESTYHIFTIDVLLDYGRLKIDGGYAMFTIQCRRSQRHFKFFSYYHSEKKGFIKYGQFPSLADFHIGEVKDYKKVLPEDKLQEFTKAIGLAAHGVGIGSFVYLRRIFEHLIYEAFEIASSKGEITKDAFHVKMDEKIKLLEHYLPAFLVENKHMYSILSLGIHQLDEEVCLQHFDSLRVGIEIILDVKLDELRKKEKMETAKKKLAAVSSSLKK